MGIKSRSFTMHKDLLQTIATKQNVDLNSGIIEAVRNCYFAFKEAGVGDRVTLDVRPDRVIISDNGPGFKNEKVFSEFGKTRTGRYGIGRMQTIRSARELESGDREIVICTSINDEVVEIFDINIRNSSYKVNYTGEKNSNHGTTITIYNDFNVLETTNYLREMLRFFDYSVILNGQEITQEFSPRNTGINHFVQTKNFSCSLRLANENDKKYKNQGTKLFISGIYIDSVEIVGGAVVGFCRVSNAKMNYKLSEATDISRKSIDLYDESVQKLIREIASIGVELYNGEYGTDESDRRMFKFIYLSNKPEEYLGLIPNDFVPALNNKYYDPKELSTVYYTDNMDMRSKQLMEHGEVVIMDDFYLKDLIRRVNKDVKIIPVTSHKSVEVEGYRKYAPTPAEKLLIDELRKYLDHDYEINFGSEYWYDPDSKDIVLKREKGILPDYSEEYLYDTTYIKNGIDADLAVRGMRLSMIKIIGVLSLLLSYRVDSRVDKFNHSEVVAVRLYRRFLRTFLSRYEAYTS